MGSDDRQYHAAEVVAVCLLLEAGRLPLLRRLLPRWEAMDLGGRRAVWVLGCHDADDKTLAEFRRLSRWPIAVAPRPSLTEGDWLVEDPAEGADLQQYGIGQSAAFMHRLATLRELVRITATTPLVPDGEGRRAADWLLWLDSDTLPPEDGFLHLHETLTATTGPLAPRVAAGLYPIRTNGAPMPHHWGSLSNGVAAYADLRVGRQMAVGYTGFGCVLMRRETAEAVDWTGYAEYRRQRRRRIEAEHDSRARADSPRPHPLGVMGEDVWWLAVCEAMHGVPVYLDTRVLCRHYHADGSYWVHEPDGDRLPTAYREDEADDSLRVTLRHRGGRAPIVLPEYDLILRPGEARRVSPEVARRAADQPGAVIGEEVRPCVSV